MKILAKPYPTTTTSKGVVIANFSSGHSFTFDDGSVIGPCLPDRVRRGAMKPIETEMEGIKGTTDIRLRFDFSDEVWEMLNEVHDDDDIDIVIVPRIVMDCIRAHGMMNTFGKARTIRIADRLKKIAHHDRFCR